MENSLYEHRTHQLMAIFYLSCLMSASVQLLYLNSLPGCNRDFYGNFPFKISSILLSSKMKTEDGLFPCQCYSLSSFVALKNLKERNTTSAQSSTTH